ncbi:MAG: hypothetical protein WED10_04095 [Brumimicrobium sp.]
MKNNLKIFAYVIIGALIMLVDAFYNGFPIVYSDTSTYLSSGFELETPFDRPITYGILLRLFSLNGVSLWLVVFFQALILSYLIFQVVKITVGNKNYLKYGAILIVLLSFLTSLSWTVSQLMPDIFTAIGLLSLLLILYGKYKQSTLIGLHFIYFISVAVHMSHVLLFGLIIIILYLFRRYFLQKKYHPRRLLRTSILLLLTVATIITMGSAVSKSRHVFFMGAMVEHGIAKTYLDEHCEEKSFALCEYKDSLPERAYQFVWDEGSPFYKIGGWKGTKTEFNEIIYGSFSQPKYIGIHIRESLKATLEQLTLFGIGDGNGSFLEETLLYKRVKLYFPHEIKAYKNSLQNQSKLNHIDSLNLVFATILLISLSLLVILLIRFRHFLNRNLKLVFSVSFVAIILNAWSCGTFANAIDRLGSKMIWLIPFLAVLFLFCVIQDRQRLR